MWVVERLFASGDEDKRELGGRGVLGEAIGEGFELGEEAFPYSSGTCFGVRMFCAGEGGVANRYR